MYMSKTLTKVWQDVNKVERAPDKNKKVTQSGDGPPDNNNNGGSVDFAYQEVCPFCMSSFQSGTPHNCPEKHKVVVKLRLLKRR